MIEWVPALLVLATLPGTVELVLWNIGVLFSKTKPLPDLKNPPPKTAVLIPAHNEEKHIQATIKSLKACVGEFAIAVIADNCTDETASLTERENVTVLKRESVNKGKHYALQFAFEQLPNYDLYIIVDADSLVQSNLVTVFQRYFQEGWQAIQAPYQLPAEGEYKISRIASIAFTAFNVMRPLGRVGWNLSAGIFGNGFALSQALVKTIPFPTDTVVEDAAYHLKLVEKGVKVVFARETTVIAEHPPTLQASSQQQQRWQGGKLRLWMMEAPRLLKSILEGKWACIEPLLELSTPPIAFYALFLFILLWTQFQSYALLAFLLLTIHLVQTLWFRADLKQDLSALSLLPYYVLRKIFSFGQVLKGSSVSQAWNRTKRKGE